MDNETGTDYVKIAWKQSQGTPGIKVFQLVENDKVAINDMKAVLVPYLKR